MAIGATLAIAGVAFLQVHTFVNAFGAVKLASGDEKIQSGNIFERICAKNLRKFYKTEEFKYFFKAVTILSLPHEILLVAAGVAVLFSTVFPPAMGFTLLGGVFVIQLVKFGTFKLMTYEKKLSPEEVEQEKAKMQAINKVYKRKRVEDEKRWEERIKSCGNDISPDIHPHLVVNGRHDQSKPSFLMNMLTKNIEELKERLILERENAEAHEKWMLNKLEKDLSKAKAINSLLKKKYIPNDEEEALQEKGREYAAAFVEKQRGFVPEEMLLGILEGDFLEDKLNIKPIDRWLTEKRKEQQRQEEEQKRVDEVRRIAERRAYNRRLVGLEA